MPDNLRPIPDEDTRRTLARQVRSEAGTISETRVPTVSQQGNGSAAEALTAPNDDGWVSARDTFTKGLEHDEFGRVRQNDLSDLVSAINQDANGEDYDETPLPGTYRGPGMGKPAAFNVPEYSGAFQRPAGMTWRGWESPLCGHNFDLQGADADQLAMPPAPRTGEDELTAEMAEVYAAALIRDVPFHEWDTDMKVSTVASTLTVLPYFKDDADKSTAAGRRRLARLKNGAELSSGNLFRGSTPGAKTGPYISQFLYLGNERRERESQGATYTETIEMPVYARGCPADADGDIDTHTTQGLISYGTQEICQAFVPHAENVDHMVEWQTWLDVQNGANRKKFLDLWHAEKRFIATPRDLATYVHFDALYQAYLNATLLLLEAGVGTDAGLPEGGGKRDAFATFGGPHILTLVCEVATRALKAVRRQKYNIHLRSRPEALAAAISLAWTGEEENLARLGAQRAAMEKMVKNLAGEADDKGLLDLVTAHNAGAMDYWTKNGWPVNHGPLGSQDFNALLPMAFPEGSPMHPSYGAGHATVAGACVTVLKAFFEMYDDVPPRGFGLYDALKVSTTDKTFYDNTFPSAMFGAERRLVVTRETWCSMSDEERKDIPFPTAVAPDPANECRTLKQVPDVQLTIQQELDKLAANIAIGRNFAGVHFYSDYHASLRMGERMAVSILQEQMLTYREPVSMRFTSFDGDHVMLVGTGGSQGRNDTPVLVWDSDGKGGDRKTFTSWWSRHTT